MQKRNKPATSKEIKSLKKGSYAHRHPNRRQRRHPSSVNKPVDVGGNQSVSGGNDSGKTGAVDGRDPSRVDEQTILEVPAVHGKYSWVYIIPYVFVRRLWATLLAGFRHLSGRP